MRIERIQAAYPDCIAYQRTGGKEKRIRMEFEYRSRNFRTHGHLAKNCDWIVCWEHDWPNAPKNLHVVELRKFFGHGFKVWLISAPPTEASGPPYLRRSATKQWKYALNEMGIPPIYARGKMRKRIQWRFRNRACKGDLVLMRHAWPDHYIEHIYRVIDEDCRKSNRGQYLVRLALVGSLVAPLKLDAIESNPLFRDRPWDAGRGNRNITAYWWELYQMILARQPDLEAVLRDFSLEKC